MESTKAGICVICKVPDIDTGNPVCTYSGKYVHRNCIRFMRPEPAVPDTNLEKIFCPYCKQALDSSKLYIQFVCQCYAHLHCARKKDNITTPRSCPRCNKELIAPPPTQFINKGYYEGAETLDKILNTFSVAKVVSFQPFDLILNTKNYLICIELNKEIRIYNICTGELQVQYIICGIITEIKKIYSFEPPSGSCISIVTNSAVVDVKLNKKLLLVYNFSAIFGRPCTVFHLHHFNRSCGKDDYNVFATNLGVKVYRIEYNNNRISYSLRENDWYAEITSKLNLSKATDAWLTMSKPQNTLQILVAFISNHLFNLQIDNNKLRQYTLPKEIHSLYGMRQEGKITIVAYGGRKFTIFDNLSFEGSEMTIYHGKYDKDNPIVEVSNIASLLLVRTEKKLDVIAGGQCIRTVSITPDCDFGVIHKSVLFKYRPSMNNIFVHRGASWFMFLD